MDIRKKIFKKIVLVFVLLISIAPALPSKALVPITEEERQYINQRDVIKAVSLNGAGPLQYTDSDGEIRGISKDLLEEISKMTGLTFEYKLYDTLGEALSSGADIFFGIPHNYAPEGMIMSDSFLKTQTILYINLSVDLNELEDKIFAAVKGSSLPNGIRPENTVYYETREESLGAVERGDADYGYGNAYSVAFYTLKNSYKNIIAVPDIKESRAYCIGFLEEDETLLNIINKSISLINKTKMGTIVLNATTQVDRDITFQMILNAYGIPIFVVALLIIFVLTMSVVRVVGVKNELKIQNERYQLLSQTSNEYLYEYQLRTENLVLSKSCIDLFGSSKNLNELIVLLNQSQMDVENTIQLIELPLASGVTGFFKSVNSPIFDDKGKVYSIIGKLIDITEEVAEKEELIKRSKTDGLTGLYNAVTTRSLVNDSIIKTNSNSKDALIVIDCDKFKSINDTYGHLQGDKVLVNISKALNQTFRKTDIIGRIGGEEFCIYMRDIPSADFVVSKCQQLMGLISKLNSEHTVTVSIGVVLLGDEKSYDELFKKADKALYKVKKKGGNQIEFDSLQVQ